MAIRKSSVGPEPGAKKASSTPRKHGTSGEQPRVRTGGSSTSKVVAGRPSSATKPRKRSTRIVAARHPARSRKVAPDDQDALVMPVTAPRQELLKKIDRLLNRGTKVTLVQGNSSVQLTGDALTALRQIFAALNAGPLSLLIGDSRDTELTSQEAADLLNVSRPYIVKLAREGTIPHTRVGNRHRFLLSDIEEHGRRQRVEREQALASMSPEGGYSDGDF